MFFIFPLFIAAFKMQIMRNMPLSTGAITNGSQHVCRHEGEGEMEGEANDLIYLYLCS